MRVALFPLLALACASCASLEVIGARSAAFLDESRDDDGREFLEQRPAAGTHVDVVLLLAERDAFDAMCRELLDSPVPLWIVAPDVARDDDAASLARFVAGLGVDRVHVVAAGRFVGLASSFARAFPERTASLALFAPAPPVDPVRAPTLVVSPLHAEQWRALGDFVVDGRGAPATPAEDAALLALWWRSAVAARGVVVVPEGPALRAVDAGALTFGFDEQSLFVGEIIGASVFEEEQPPVRPPVDRLCAGC